MRADRVPAGIMRAVRVDAPGGPEALCGVDVPTPQPGPGEVRVRIAAIGVNYADVLCRRAVHRSMRLPPIVPGCEASGVIETCGEGVGARAVGERVVVYSPFGGTYADAVVVPEAYALPLIDSMSFDDAAALAHVALTAHMALCGSGSVAAGQTLLVTAAAGGLGGALIQLARAIGLRVIAAVGSEAKRDHLRARGVEDVPVYGDDPLDRQVLALTRGRGADLIVETVGGAIYRQAEAALAPMGSIVIAGAAAGELPRPHVPTLLARSARCATLNLSVVFAEQPQRCHDAWDTILGLYADGSLVPRIGRRFALEDAVDAHRLIESRLSVDKILLQPARDPGGTRLAYHA